MASVTQDMKYRLSLLTYAKKHGVTDAAIRYRTNRQYIYRWLSRYDGSLESLRERSRRPHGHKRQHTQAELKLIHDMRRRNAHLGLVVFWVKLRQRGYNRHVTSLYRVLRREGIMPIKPQNPKRKSKPYEQMVRPGQRVQIDVKHVPAACLVGQVQDSKLYHYTAIDEFSRYRYVEAFEEISTYSSTIFLKRMLRHFNFPVECVQTDNGLEFTNRFSKSRVPRPTLFLLTLREFGIRHKMIRPFTPRHNGKVEGSHRKDNEYFYAITTFYSLADFQSQLYRHNYRYNSFPMRPLGWKSPLDTLMDYWVDGVTYV